MQSRISRIDTSVGEVIGGLISRKAWLLRVSSNGLNAPTSVLDGNSNE
jgi:hypothetical protein